VVRRRTLPLVSLPLVSLALVAVACASDRRDDGPPVHDGRGGSSGQGASPASGGDENVGGEPSTSGAAGTGGAAQHGDAGEGGHAGQGASGTPSDAGAGGGLSGTDPPPIDELCPREPALGTPEKLSSSTDADERFGGITPDELVIAWTVTVDETVTLFVATRDAADAAFGTPVSTTIEAALDERVALGPDGLRVAFVNADRRGFSVISRPTLDDAFGLATPGEFALLDATGGGLPAGQSYADPVLSGDGVSFFYSQYGAEVEDTLRVSSRLSVNDPWPAGGVVAASGLSAREGDRFAPTGASRDGRTLFLWDSAARSTLIAFVDDTSFELAPVADIGALQDAAPNDACTRLYYSAADPSLDLFVVTIGE
jgi:hypothetical protein